MEFVFPKSASLVQCNLMVNYQTSLYEILNLFFYLSRLDVFQYFRDLLQVTVSLDHPVAILEAVIWQLPLMDIDGGFEALVLTKQTHIFLLLNPPKMSLHGNCHNTAPRMATSVTNWLFVSVS